MHNLSNKIPQCSELYRGLFEKGGGRQRVTGFWAVWEKTNVILPLGSRGGLREICLFILKGGEIQYGSDGNWIVPDTTCLLPLSFIFSSPLSPFSLRVNLLTGGGGCHFPLIFVTTDFFLLRVFDTAACTRHKQAVGVSLYVSSTTKLAQEIRKKINQHGK